MILENHIFNGDCRELLPTYPSNIANLFIFSPPYNVNIPYSDWNDSMSVEDYTKFTEDYLTELYRIGMDDCRYCINIPYEVNLLERGGRMLFLNEYFTIAKKVGFKFAGLIDLEEDSAHRVKNTAWGSWLSPSSPYFYNPKECILVLYKKQWKRIEPGTSYFNQYNKKEFIDLVKGIWKYDAQTQKITEANYSLDIPLKCLKLFSYEDDLVIDPFMGSGQTAIACKLLNRRYSGIEISPEYHKIAVNRVKEHATLMKFM